VLTDLQIEKLTIPTTRREIPDGKIGGLYLVVQPSGAKSWALRYRVAGAPKKFTIGPYPAIGLAVARKRAQRALAEVVDGVDPSATKRAAREALKAASEAEDRVESVVDAYVKGHLAKKAKPSWAKEAERLLRVEVLPKFGKKRLGDLTGDDIHKLLKEIAERAPITANRAFAVFRKLCHWAMSRDGGKLIKTSPCDGVEVPSPERERERVLDDAEVRLACEAFDSIGWPFGPVGKLLLLTGARRDEVASMEWRELDLEAAVWRIPKERTKNKRAHEIPLPAVAVDILRGLPRVEAKRGADGRLRPALVFTTTGATPVSGFSRAKDAIDAFIVKRLREDAETRGADPEEVKAPDWVMHDIRRTVATNLQKLGVRLEVTEAVLNHVSGSRAGIVGVYQRHEYAAEKRAALEAWSRRLAAIVSGEALSTSPCAAAREPNSIKFSAIVGSS
jgi:integrase